MPRILLVDDDPDILETVRWALEHDGHVVDERCDARAVFEAAHRQPPDLLVLDVMLPGGNGYDVSRFLKEEMRGGRLPAFPILILTARRVASAERQAFLATWSGADASMWKPFDIGLLMERVRALLSGAGVAAEPVAARGAAALAGASPHGEDRA